MATEAKSAIPLEAEDRRYAPRRAVMRDSTLRDSSGMPSDVVVRDLSADGFSVDTDTLLAIGSVVRVGLVGIGTVEGEVIRRTSNGYGCRTSVPISGEQLHRAFSLETVVPGTFPSFLLPAADALPVVVPWPPVVRLVVAVGLVATLWLGIVWIV